MKNQTYTDLKKSNNKITNGDFTFLMGEKPFYIHDNGTNVFKVLVIWNKSRIGRVIYDRYTVTDL